MIKVNLESFHKGRSNIIRLQRLSLKVEIALLHEVLETVVACLSFLHQLLTHLNLEQLKCLSQELRFLFIDLSEFFHKPLFLVGSHTLAGHHALAFLPFSLFLETLDHKVNFVSEGSTHLSSDFKIHLRSHVFRHVISFNMGNARIFDVKYLVVKLLKTLHPVFDMRIILKLWQPLSPEEVLVTLELSVGKLLDLIHFLDMFVPEVIHDVLGQFAFFASLEVLQ